MTVGSSESYRRVLTWLAERQVLSESFATRGGGGQRESGARLPPRDARDVADLVDSHAMGWYLCYFLHRHLDFRREELQALADMAGCGADIKWREPHGGVDHSPFWRVYIPTEELAVEVCRRSVLTRALIEVWGEGDTQEELNAAVKAFPDERKDPYIAEGTTFKVCVEDFGKTEHGTEKNPWSHVVARIDALKPVLQFRGRARMKGPQHLFWSIESANADDLKGVPSDIPPRRYFGRVVATGDRSPLSKYDLKKRRYLGPTSMDVEMGLIMCNMIQARPGGVVWDPFCGTGSLLINAAHFGALTMGSDIDIRVIKWGKKDKRTGQNVDVWTNFEDYGLEPPVGLLRMDLHKHSWTSSAHAEGTLQGVVGDPPYGVRAGGRKSGGRKRGEDGTVKPVPEEHRENHIPSTAPYPFSECMDDLMDTSARLLAVGGRLAFFIPAAADPEDAAAAGVDSVPSHPMLTLRASSVQLLSARWGRRLVTFEKVKPYDAAVARGARETLRERRKTEGGVEDLLERMREVVYQPRGDQGVDEDGNAKPRRKRGTGPSGGKFTPTPSKPEEAAALRAAGGGGEVGAMHRAHSAVGVKMDKAKRPEFRGKNT